MLKVTITPTSAKRLEAEIDAVWAPEAVDKSQTGFALLLEVTPLQWSSNKQQIITVNSTEA